MSEETNQENNKNAEKIELALEQKEKLRDFWNSAPKDQPRSLKDMVECIFPGEDARSKYGIAVKKALSEMKIKAKPSSEYIPKNGAKEEVLVELTETQKQFIQNNINQSPSELVKLVFENQLLTSQSPQYKAVVTYLRSLPSYQGILPLESYSPPRNFIETFARINKYAPHKLDRDKLTPQQNKEIEITQKFLEDARFNHMINTYLKREERDLFEGSFIKYVYNKADLSNEELDQYINLANAMVTEMKYVEELNICKERSMQILEGGTISKALVDRISALEGNISEVKGYQDKLIKSLQGERSRRIERKVSENSSVLALIEAWKHKQHRQRMIKYAQAQEATISKEVKRIETMEAIKASLFGVSPEEIVPIQTEDKKDDNSG